MAEEESEEELSSSTDPRQREFKAESEARSAYDLVRGDMEADEETISLVTRASRAVREPLRLRVASERVRLGTVSLRRPKPKSRRGTKLLDGGERTVLLMGDDLARSRRGGDTRSA